MMEDVNKAGIHVVSKLIDADYASEGPLYLISPDTSESEYYINCRLKSVAESLTFTKQQMNFNFLSDFSLDKDIQSAIAGYQPLPGIRLRLDPGGAEDIVFEGGFQEQNLFGFENARVILPGSVVGVHWSDLYNEQMRDIYLIVIGSLIAIGVTTLIEGLRPFIERLGETKPEKPPLAS